jgi:hypothetical protein
MPSFDPYRTRRAGQDYDQRRTRSAGVRDRKSDALIRARALIRVKGLSDLRPDTTRSLFRNLHQRVGELTSFTCALDPAVAEAGLPWPGSSSPRNSLPARMLGMAS